MSLDEVEALEKLSARYVQAWNDHDLDAICAMQADDAVVSLGGAGGVQEPSNSPISFGLHDVLEFERGWITRKNAWIDGIAIRRQLVDAAGAPDGAR